MAGLILGVVGNALGGPIGGALGSLVGAYVDRTVLAPLLGPKTSQDGLRVSDFRVPQQDEGSKANWVLGGRSRVGCVFLYASPIKEVTRKKRSGGFLGSGGSTTVSYSYYCTLALELAIQRGVVLSRIFADGEVIYDANSNRSVTGIVIAAASIGTSDIRMKLTAPDGGPDLSVFRSGYDAAVSGFANAANNGTFKVEQAGVDSGGTFVILHNTSPVAEAAGASVTIAQSLPNYDGARIENVTTYDGSQTTADSDLEGLLGAGNVPAYAGTSYIVLRNLNLTPFGNRIPQISFEVGSATGGTIRTAIEALCQRAGMTSDQVDASRLTGTNRGYALQGPVSPAAAMQPLFVRHDVVTQEADGKIRFFHRADARIVYIPREDLAAAEGLTVDRPDPWERSRGDAYALPPRIFVTYLKSANGEKGGEPDVRNGEESAALQEMFLPLTLTAAEARAVERRLMYAAQLANETHRLKPSTKWMGLGENDVIATWWTPGELVFLQVLKVDLDPDFNLAVEAQLFHRSVLTQTAESDDSEDDVPRYAPGGAVDADVFDIPWTIGGFGPSDQIKIPVAAAMPDERDRFPGAVIMSSLDDDEYEQVGELGDESTFGRARTALGGAGIDPETWDLVSSVDVEVWDGELESRTEAEVLEGANAAVIGNEIIRFVNAELIGTRLYRLTTLLRGVRDTDDQMTTHAADERFLLLSDPGPAVVEMQLAALNVPRWWKVVLTGRSPDDTPGTPFTPTGKNLRPFAPHGLVATRDGSGNLTATFQRRTRVPVQSLPGAPTPLGEQDESYDVELWWGSTLRRTLSLTTPAFSYTAGQQTTDGVDLFSGVEVRIYQRSASYGRGRGLVETV